MASQSAGKASFATIAAKQAANPTPTPNFGYDRRRALKFSPVEPNTKLTRDTCKQFVANLRNLIAPSPPTEITAIRLANEVELHAVLATPALVDNLVAKSPIEIAGQALKITEFVPRSRKIWLYNPSILISNLLIKTELSKHVQTMHVEDITNELLLPTGKLFAYVRGDIIPSAIFIGAVRINITYSGMERRCRNCQSPEHAAGQCPERECFNCHKKGHVSSECASGCRRCGASGHQQELRTDQNRP